MVKAILLDFDGTLVTRDILSLLCGIVGKEALSEELDRKFHEGKLPGVQGLLQRIELLKGVPLTTINHVLAKADYLMPGADELLDYARRHHIKTILHSGNIQPVLKHYQRRLGIDYILGPQCDIIDDVITGKVQPLEPGFKLTLVKQTLADLGIAAADTLAIGDSPADIPVFDFAGHAIAINPKNDAADHAQYVIHNSLVPAIKILGELA